MTASAGSSSAAVETIRSGQLLADLAGTLVGHLDGGQRLNVIDTLGMVLSGLYAHLPAKRAAYARDPVQALVLLRRRAAELTDVEFNLAVIEIMTGLRDAHTRYSGPSTADGRVAALPFLLEQCGPDHDRRFIVSKVNSAVIDDPGFVEGVEVISWSGVPMARAVDVYAEREYGGRPDARRARALETLTARSLRHRPPPDEHWVVVGYRTARGAHREVRIDWRVLTPGRASGAMDSGARSSLKVSADLAAEEVRRSKKLQFAPAAWQAEDVSPLADTVTATDLGRGLGHLRIWSFDVSSDSDFVAEVERLVRDLPQRRLIVDLRGNPGGLVWAAERCLQLFTTGPVVPTRFSLLATPLTRAMADDPFNRLELESWSASLQDAVTTGEQWSQPLPLTDPAWCNDLDYTYPGKVICVADATTYSSGDLFAAGWVDNAIGPLVTVGRATGGGGANVWTHRQVKDSMVGEGLVPPVMPEGTGFTVAVRRAIRSAAADGIPIEDLGIPGIAYDMTRRDLLEGNRDLFAFCRTVLDEQ